MIKFVRLILLRPNERFFAQCISISIEPSAFVRERIRLGDTTNFARAAGFFVSAISTAFLAEVATLHLLGIGGLAEPYYWLVILLTSIPFVLLCFLLLWLVARLSFKNVLHLSFYPVGAGVFAGAAFALVVSAVVALSVAVGFADNIKHDFEGWETGVALYEEVLRECQKEESLTYTIVAAGFGEAYESLKPPIDSISYLRPVITILYLIVAASFFMAAVDRRKWVVFSLVLFAAVIATGANFTLFKTYLDWNLDRSGCTEEKLGELARARMGESLLRRFAADLNEDKETNDVWDISYRAEGRTLLETYRFKKPITDFYSLVPKLQKLALESYCAHDNPFLRNLKATRASLYYSVEGERLTSFSISPADCPQW